MTSLNCCQETTVDLNFLLPKKLSFDNDGIITIFSDQDILKEFKTSPHAFTETSGIAFKQNENNHRCNVGGAFTNKEKIVNMDFEMSYN